MAKIILSYRRSDARAMAGRIRDKLASRYGERSVYMDVDNIPFGTDFRKHFNAALDEGDIVVAIIGPGWLGAGQGAQPRILDETDPVRVEIETALRRGIAIVPILIDGATMPKPAQLPDSLGNISFLNAAEVDDGRDFHQHMDRVIRSMNSILKSGKRTSQHDVKRKRYVRALAIVGAVCVLVAAAWAFAPQLRQQVEKLAWSDNSGKTPSPAADQTSPREERQPLPVNPPPAAGAGSRRVALVIGNAAYQNTAPLRTPANDATVLSAQFRAAGFAIVETKLDLSGAMFRRALRDFSEAVQSADMAVVFYAGHGMELNGSNYLIPVDATLKRDIDVEDEAVALTRVLYTLEDAKRLRLLILDASRDNPFVKDMKRTRGGASRGMVPVEPTSVDTLVALSAKAGTIGEDGSGPNSPYAAALAKHLFVPGLDVRLAFGRIRDELLHSTNGRQEPFVYGSLGGSLVSLVDARN
jgi:hypothetical protein